MIVEQRHYTMHVGHVAAYLELFGEEGLPLQKQYLGRYIGTFTTEIGPLNRVVHMWAYDSLEDRMSRRAELAADERWQALLPRVRTHIQHQENLVMSPAPFSPPLG